MNCFDNSTFVLSKYILLFLLSLPRVRLMFTNLTFIGEYLP